MSGGIGRFHVCCLTFLSISTHCRLPQWGACIRISNAICAQGLSVLSIIPCVVKSVSKEYYIYNIHKQENNSFTTQSFMLNNFNNRQVNNYINDTFLL